MKYTDDFKKGLASEDSKYKPNSPYAASKASSDLICRSFYKTYGIPIIICNSSNNYGQRQFLEKFIPRSICMMKMGMPLKFLETANKKTMDTCLR